jgi:hypothetical protein
MNLQHSPILAAVVVKQRHQDLRHEAQRDRAARAAESASRASKRSPWTQLTALAASMHAVSAHRLSGAASRVAFRLSAW